VSSAAAAVCGGSSVMTMHHDNFIKAICDRRRREAVKHCMRCGSIHRRSSPTHTFVLLFDLGAGKTTKNELDERDSSVLRSGTDHKEMWTMDLDRKAHSFIPGLKPSFSANPSHCSLPFLHQN